MRSFAFVLLACLSAAGAAAAETVLITGANRGIGFEFARQYAARGWTVIATARNPGAAGDLNALAAEHPNLSIEQLELTDHAAIDALAARLQGTAIDVLLNNAGVFGSPEDQTLGSLDYGTFANVMAVNVYAPLKMAEAFRSHVAASGQKKIVTMTSGAGSVTSPGRGDGRYFYAASKAGLNKALRGLNTELSADGIIVGIIAPGIVETDMLVDAQLVGRGMPPEESVAGLIRVIDGLTLENASAAVFNYDGSEVPW